MNIGAKPRTGGTALIDSLATGEAKPRRTSGGKAASKELLRQTRVGLSEMTVTLAVITRKLSCSQLPVYPGEIRG